MADKVGPGFQPAGSGAFQPREESVPATGKSLEPADENVCPTEVGGEYLARFLA
jgi:hypothetical protein